MDLKQQLNSEQYEHLINILNSKTEEHAKRHVRAFGSASGLSYTQYLNKFNILEYQKVQKMWFTNNFKIDIYDKVFPNGAPDSFQPGTPIRDNIFASGVVVPARRAFMCLTLRHLMSAIKEEWQSHGAKELPEAALYF